MTDKLKETIESPEQSGLASSNCSRFITWKWLIVVIFVAIPMAITLTPTAILRIVTVNISDWIEFLDDWLHDKWLGPFEKAKAWSENPSAKAEDRCGE